ncbi:MAG: spore coat associated protein CotJA [Lachnospiraceae bacterium]|nr:spore coat associated protein CotJA [Lachnospiraceae bacterium]MBQ9142839.1 spore coat associated protein CotJA [Lachnospiraceae bacterium]
MNVNRQNNCYSGCSGRPNAVVNRGCCNVVPVQPASCCNNAVAGNIIVGGCAEAACNKETTLRDCPIAMAYVPWQDYGNIYAQPQALRNGTMFAELNLDFAGRRCN